MNTKKNNWEIVKLYNDICQRSRFDILASGRYILNSVGYKKRLANDIREKLHLRKEDILLDLGCNVGIYHSRIASHVNMLIGVDGAEASIVKARKQNPQTNISYRTFDILGDWPPLNQSFNKVLVYSVVHFFDSLEDIRSLFKKIVQANRIHNSKIEILFGEVRTKEQYDRFLIIQREKKSRSWRDRKFMLNRTLSKLFLGNVQGFPCTSFSIQEIIKVGEEFGFKGVLLPQQSFHPFYNTCSDFIFEST